MTVKTRRTRPVAVAVAAGVIGESDRGGILVNAVTFADELTNRPVALDVIDVESPSKLLKVRLIVPVWEDAGERTGRTIEEPTVTSGKTEKDNSEVLLDVAVVTRPREDAPITGSGVEELGEIPGCLAKEGVLTIVTRELRAIEVANIVN